MIVKKYFLETLIIGILLVPMGCEVKQVLKVKPDGSGTLEITTGISKDLIGAMKTFKQRFRKPPREGAPKELPSFEETLEEAIKHKVETWLGEIGRNVELKEIKKNTQDKMIYFTAAYSFKDIRELKLKLFETPNDYILPLFFIPIDLPFFIHLWEDKLFTFDLKKLPDDSVELTIINPFGTLITEALEELTKEAIELKPSEKKDDSGEEETGPDEPADISKMVKKTLRETIKDVVCEFTIVVEGKITEADVRLANNKIALVNINFGTIAKDQEKLKSFIKEYEGYGEDPSIHDKTPEELIKMSLKSLMRALGNDIITPKEQIRIRFK